MNFLFVIGSIVLLVTIFGIAGFVSLLARAIEVANAVYEECDRT